MTIHINLSECHLNRILEAAEGWGDLGETPNGGPRRSDDMEAAFLSLESQWRDSDEPITAEWLKSCGIGYRVDIPGSIYHIYIATLTGLNFDFASVNIAIARNDTDDCDIELPHIKTRSQLLTLIRLLAPDVRKILNATAAAQEDGDMSEAEATAIRNALNRAPAISRAAPLPRRKP